MTNSFKFRKSFFQVLFGKLLSSTANILGVILYVKIYPPSEIGYWVSSLSLLGLINTISLLKSDCFIPVRKIYGAKNIIYKLASDSFAYITIPLCTVALSLAFILSYLHIASEQFRLISFAFPFLILIESIFAICISVLNSGHRFKYVSIVGVFRAYTKWGFVLLLSIFSKSLTSLLFAYIISSSSALIFCIFGNHGLKYKIHFILFSSLTKQVRFSKMKVFYMKIIRCLGYMTKSVGKSNFYSYDNSLYENALLTTIGQLFSNFWGVGMPALIALSFSSDSAAFFALGLSISVTPLSILSSSIGAVFWQFACSNLNDNPIAVKQKFVKLSSSLILPSFALILVLAFIFYYGIPYLNTEWLSARILPFVLIPWSIGLIISQSTTHLAAHKLQNKKLLVDMCLSASILILVYLWKILALPYIYFILSMSLLIFFSYAVIWFINFNALNRALLRYNYRIN